MSLQARIRFRGDFGLSLHSKIPFLAAKDVDGVRGIGAGRAGRGGA
jgi:hypothetical protein